MKHSVFDYIVVGAGSAGCVLANRLSADPGRRVLLLEAGQASRNLWLRLPIGYFKTIYDPRFTWQFPVEPQAATADRAIAWPRGRVLGGSSAINGLLYIRGQHADFDDWERAGARGWNFRSVLPYFKRSENYIGGPSEYHGTGGELQVSDLRNDHPCCQAWLQAGREAGFAANDDFNGPETGGLGAYQLTIGRRWRSDAASAFLNPIRSRSNLEIRTGARITRVLLERGRAVGVEWIGAEGLTQARVNAEVVLSAGAIQSPHLLQLSGIGPPELLRRHGIPVHVDAPEVGENLQDHYQARVIVRLRRRISLNDQVRNPAALLAMGLQWLIAGRGPLTVGAGQVGGMVCTEFARDGRPDILFNVMPLSVDKPGDPLHRFSGFSASAAQCRPLSRGRVQLRSANPVEPPHIVANYLTEPEDGRVLAAGLRLLREIHAQPAFRDFVDSEYRPGADIHSAAELESFARRTGGTVFHPTSTCRMGDDARSVVDPELCVRGIEGLRVADASVMPMMISTNTNAAAIMIGERAADHVLGRRLLAP